MSQPALQRGCKKASRMGQGCIFHWRKMRGVATNFYSRKTSEKPKWKRLKVCVFWKWGFGSLFSHEEGISTPRASHKGCQPLIKCANHDFKTMYFPLLCFIIFFFFLCFLLFWGRQGCFLRSYVFLNGDEEIRAT